MENMELYNLPSWALEAEEDFQLGAKATPSFPSTTEANVSPNSTSFDLPEWMENRDVLRFSRTELSESGLFRREAIKKWEMYDNEEEFSRTIKPEDMFVPLSEFKPQNVKDDTQTPSPVVPNPEPQFPSIASPSQSIPKIIVCQKVSPDHSCKMFAIKHHTVPDNQYLATAGTSSAQCTETPKPEDDISTCDAEDLINEMVQMIESDSGEVFDSDNSIFNSSMIESDLDGLLSHLESTSQESDDLHAKLEPSSPLFIPSPVPSVGSLSPFQDKSDSMFATLLSPSDSKYEALSSQSDEGCEDSFDELKAHSYSRSPLKKKIIRKSSSSKSPYPKDRKERKKEQNKQAALRYRQKKKQEEDEIQTRISAEEKKREELKEKCMGLKQELKFMKKMLREVFIAKGILTEESFKNIKV